MKDVDKKNIIFLSDENTPYAKEFTLLSDEEIVDLVERRLFSNNYFNYTIYSIHKSKGTIVLTREACGHNVETTLPKIEDGLIPEKCVECRQVEKEKLIAFKNEIQDDLKERGLVVVLFETEEDSDSLYIECTKCCSKYYLNDNFSLDNKAWEMYCKNWDCMMDVLMHEDHWFAKGIESRNIVIKENNYTSYFSHFIQDYEDWFEDLTASDGSYEYKCENCETTNILPFGDWGVGTHECNACSCDLNENNIIERWDALSDKVTILCKKCGSKYYISCNDAERNIFDCFECYKKASRPYVCPVCSKKHDTVTIFDDYCETCGFPIYDNVKWNDQTYYTKWLKNTVIPAKRVWNKIVPDYIKVLKDLNASLEERSKLLTNNRTLNEKLSQCYTEITEYNKKLSALNEEIRKLKEKTAVVGILESYFEQKSKGEVMYECSGESKIDKVLSITLEEMDFSVRTYNCLKRAGINTVEHLIEMNYNEVLTIKNLCKKNFEEVINKLAMLGLYLKE